MTQYLYPKNLRATANLWLWSLKDFCILGISALLSIVILVQTKFVIPAAVTLCYGFLSIRMDETTVLDFIKYAVRYFIGTQQEFRWRQAEPAPNLHTKHALKSALRACE